MQSKHLTHCTSSPAPLKAGFHPEGEKNLCGVWGSEFAENKISIPVKTLEGEGIDPGFNNEVVALGLESVSLAFLLH